jgi:glycolate oxidase
MTSRLGRLAVQLQAGPVAGSEDDDVGVALEAAVNTARRAHLAGGTPLKQASKEWQNRVLNLHELVPLARQSLPATTWSYLRGGSDTEQTLKRNRFALDSLALEQSILNDVSQIDPSTTIFGRDLAMPVITAPMGNITSLDEAHYSPRDTAAGTAGGQVSCARAAARSGVGHCLSSLGRGWDSKGSYMEEVAAAGEEAGGGLKIFQLYIRGDWAFVKDMAERAVATGWDAFAITVDVALNSRRDRHIADRGTKGPASVGGRGGMEHQAAFSWIDVARFKAAFPSSVMPLIIKGVMGVADALKCLEHGVDGIWVSNHGGRQLDHGKGTMTALPRIAKAVGAQGSPLPSDLVQPLLIPRAVTGDY